MQRLLTWLGNKLFHKETATQRPQPRVVARAISKPTKKVAPKPKPAKYSSEVGGKIEDGGPGKNVLVRNKYLPDDGESENGLSIVGESGKDSGNESGIDPYNTGRFDRSKSWDSFRTRK